MKVKFEQTVRPATAEQHCMELQMMTREGNFDLLKQCISDLQSPEGHKRWPNGEAGIKLYLARLGQA